MDTKGISVGVEIKNEARREISCVFSTFNIIDSDNEVVVPGAVPHGKAVMISSYGHGVWKGVPPVGRGMISTTSTEATFTGSFFDSAAGHEHFAVVKEMGDLQEWSWGFSVQDAEYGQFQGQRVRFLKSLTPYEVSPVLKGANPATRTLATSAKDADIRARIEATEYRMAQLIGMKFQAEQLMRAEQDAHAAREIMSIYARLREEGVI